MKPLCFVNKGKVVLGAFCIIKVSNLLHNEKRKLVAKLFYILDDHFKNTHVIIVFCKLGTQKVVNVLICCDYLKVP